MRTWCSLWHNIFNKWFIAENSDISQIRINDVDEIKRAVQEMATARTIYSEVNDPELVDWAVYSLTAAEKRYEYLLKKYRLKS